MATFLLLVVVQVVPPGIPIFKLHSEHHSMHACIEAARKLDERTGCVPLPWVPVVAASG